MPTCVIRDHIDPTRKEAFAACAQPGPGDPALRRRSRRLFRAAGRIEHARLLAAAPLGRENYLFARREKFVLREVRTFLKCVSTPHGAKT